jgi:glycerol-3-phosphate O-acyltransferase/dihydroxyacetone phosphate acyltransferase
MSLGAMAEHNCKNVKIVPVGLNYFNREKFRSEVNIEFGKPFEVPSQWAEEFKTNKRDVTEKLLKEVESRMKAVTLIAPTIEELRAVLLLRKVYVPKTLKLSPTEVSELNKRFIKGYSMLKDVAECKEMLRQGTDYIREIDELGLEDKDVLNTEFEQKKMKRKFLLSVVIFFALLIFVTPMLLIVLPFIVYVRKVAEKERLAVSLYLFNNDYYLI